MFEVSASGIKNDGKQFWQLLTKSINISKSSAVYYLTGLIPLVAGDYFNLVNQNTYPGRPALRKNEAYVPHLPAGRYAAERSTFGLCRFATFGFSQLES